MFACLHRALEDKTVGSVNAGTFTACGGDVTFWKLKKFWYFTDNHITVIITIYRECYHIKRNVGIV